MANQKYSELKQVRGILEKNSRYFKIFTRSIDKKNEFLLKKALVEQNMNARIFMIENVSNNEHVKSTGSAQNTINKWKADFDTEMHAQTAPLDAEIKILDGKIELAASKLVGHIDRKNERTIKRVDEQLKGKEKLARNVFFGSIAFSVISAAAFYAANAAAYILEQFTAAHAAALGCAAAGIIGIIASFVKYTALHMEHGQIHHSIVLIDDAEKILAEKEKIKEKEKAAV